MSGRDVKNNDQPFALVVLGAVLDTSGAFAGLFGIIVACYTRFHKQFWLVIFHQVFLLVSTLARLSMWIAIVTLQNSPNGEKYQACFDLKVIELVCRSISNCVSSAMMWWYFQLNRSMLGYSRRSLRKIGQETGFYLLGILMICLLCLGGTFVFINRVELSPTYCFVDIIGDKNMEILSQIIGDIPIFVPLLLGTIWFLLSRTWYRYDLPDVEATQNLRRLHKLFYWLNWSFIAAQLPKLVLGGIANMIHTDWAQTAATVAAQWNSTQNITDGIALFSILVLPLYQHQQNFRKPSAIGTVQTDPQTSLNNEDGTTCTTTDETTTEMVYSLSTSSDFINLSEPFLISGATHVENKMLKGRYD